MLHLILGILKIIGILLLVFLGLLLLLLLTLSFVPVRYELAGKKKEGAAAARGKITWLFRLVSMTAGYRGARLQVRLKVLCFTLFQFGTGGAEGKRSRSGGKKKKEPETGAERPERKAEEEPKDGPERKAEEEPEDGPERKAEEEPEDGPERKLEEEPEKGPRKEMEPDRTVSPHTPEIRRSDTQENRPEKEPKPQRKRRFELAGKLEGLWRRICRAAQLLASLPERLLDLPDKLQDFFWAADGRLERLSQRLESLQRRIEPYSTPESVALYKRLLWRLKYLWRHFGPRRLSGWLRFGTGAPDLTGQLAGLIYLMLPASAEDFEVRPDFTEPVLEADVVIKGHIRACHLMRMAFGLWRDKELRKMIRRIKGGNENG